MSDISFESELSTLNKRQRRSSSYHQKKKTSSLMSSSCSSSAHDSLSTTSSNKVSSPPSVLILSHLDDGSHKSSTLTASPASSRFASSSPLSGHTTSDSLSYRPIESDLEGREGDHDHAVILSPDGEHSGRESSSVPLLQSSKQILCPTPTISDESLASTSTQHF